MTATLSGPPAVTPAFLPATGFRAVWDRRSDDKALAALRAEHLYWLEAEDLGAFAYSLSGRETRVPADAPPAVSRKALFACVMQAADPTVPEEVAQNLGRFEAGLPTIRVAHQPNFLPSLNVALQPAHQNDLARLLGADAVSELLLVVDYDVTANRRYRNAQFPSLGCADGYLTLSAPSDPGDGERLMRHHEAPEAEFLQRTLDRVWTVVQRDLRRLQHTIELDRVRELRSTLAGRLRHLRAELDAAAKAAAETGDGSMPDFNASFLRALVNDRWRMPTIFLRGQRCLPLMAEHIEYLWDRGPELTGASLLAAIMLEQARVPVRDSFVRVDDEVPFWFACSCGRRTRLYWAGRPGGVAQGTCRCGASEKIGRHRVRELAIDGKLIPRVVADDLLDGLAWRHRAGCGYRGGLEHHVFANLVASLMGLPQVPEFLSRRDPMAELSTIDTYREMLDGVGTPTAAAVQRLLADGRGSVVHSLLWAESGFHKFEKPELLAH